MPTNASVKRALSAMEKDTSKVLGLTMNGKPVETKQYIPRAEAQKAPELTFPVPDPSATYMVVCLDLDAPFPSFGVLGPILHWIQPGLKADADGKLSASEPFVANYIGPAPPPGSGPHRYTFFLFEQPADFDGKNHSPEGGKPLPNMKRMRYDLDQWISTARLKDAIAVNYFMSN